MIIDSVNLHTATHDDHNAMIYYYKVDWPSCAYTMQFFCKNVAVSFFMCKRKRKNRNVFRNPEPKNFITALIRVTNKLINTISRDRDKSMGQRRSLQLWLSLRTRYMCIEPPFLSRCNRDLIIKLGVGIDIDDFFFLISLRFRFFFTNNFILYIHRYLLSIFNHSHEPVLVDKMLKRKII